MTNSQKMHKIKMIYVRLLCLGAVLLVGCGQQEVPNQDSVEVIFRYNQVGYLPDSEKLAVVVNPINEPFKILNQRDEVVLSGKLTPPAEWDKSGEITAVADFTEVRTPGKYRISIAGQTSSEFEIGEDLYDNILSSAAKSFYLIRASTDLPEEHAGVFARQGGHPDDVVQVHASAATDRRPAGTEISVSGGWYDAGDYNKYVVNSGITTYTLLSAYEQFSSHLDTATWNIPESENEIPDILDEAIWNIDWMSGMQDEDGGVYHKLTTANFEGMVMPTEATNKRYVVAKGTAATLDFAAVLSKASRLIAPFDSERAEKWLAQAQSAYEWAEQNPEVYFKNPKEQDDHPAINTGEYGDGNVTDEFEWAALELFLSTEDSKYLSKVNLDTGEYKSPTWGSVRSLGLLSLINAPESVKGELNQIASKQFYRMADELRTMKETSPYRISIDRFVWGSCSDAANQSMVLLNAYLLSKDKTYFDAAVSGMDYILGKNATGYSFVTGFGNKYPMKIHHRISEADDVEEPFPGFLIGGPNPYNASADCGEEAYPSLLPAKAFADVLCSYSTNETAINWTAPLVYITAGIHTTYQFDQSAK